MPSYKKDTSSIQVTDYASLIWHTNMSIMESLTYANYAAVPPLVDHLETLLHPYFDEIYSKDIGRINDEKPKSGRTVNEIRANETTLREKQVLSTHRALMDLAYRKRFLPAASGSVSNEGFILQEGDV